MSNQIEETPSDFFEKESIFHSVFDTIDETVSKNPLWIIVPPKFDISTLGTVIACSQFQKKAKSMGIWVKRYYFLFENNIGYASAKNVLKIKKYIHLEGLKIWMCRGDKSGDKNEEKDALSPMLGFFRCNQYFMLRSQNEDTIKEWISYLRKKCIMVNLSHFYSIQKMLGKGSYGKVFLIQSNENKKMYAAKMISKNQMITKLLGLETIFNEIKILRKMDHKNIIKIHEVFETPTSLYLIIDYVDGEELKTFMQKKTKYSESECVPIMKNILETLVYLHNKKIVHRDLKLENILVTSKGDLEVKLIDFGLSIDLNEVTEAKRGGTPGYIAPEILNSQTSKAPISTKCDMFSMGCLFYRLLTGGKLFYGNTAKELLDNNRDCIINPSKISFLIKSNSAKELLSKMLEIDPLKRISAAEALSHPFFSNEKPSSFIEFADCPEDINVSPVTHCAFDMSQIKDSNIFSFSKVFDSNGTIQMIPHISHDNAKSSANSSPLKIPLGLGQESSYNSLSGFGKDYAGESSVGSCMTPSRLNFDGFSGTFSNSNSPSHSPNSKFRDMKQKGYSPFQKSSFSNTLTKKLGGSPGGTLDMTTPGSKRLAVTGGFSDFYTQIENNANFSKKLMSIGETKDNESPYSNQSHQQNLS